MKLTVLSTSDSHGYLYATDFREKQQSLDFGLTKVVSKIKEIEKNADGLVLKIDNGDFLQGSPFSYYLAKNKNEGSMADVMNAVGFDCGVLGNHEFNYGLDYLEETIAKINYPIVCANILKKNGDYLTGQPYVIFERDGLKIAVLGLTTQYIPNWEQPSTVEGLVFRSAFETAKEFVPKLREKADIVIVSYHGGFEKDLETGVATEVLTGENEGYDLLHHVPGIDILLTGHQHRVISTVVNNIPVTQPGDKGRYIGKIETTINEAKQIEDVQAELVTVATYEEDKELVTKFSPLLDKVQIWLDKELGKVNGDMWIDDPMEVRKQSHPYIDFIQNVQKEATGASISGTALFDNNGKGFGETISMRDIVTNYIYPNTLAVLKVTGAELRLALERSAGYFDLNDKNELCVSKEFLEPKVEHYNYDIYSGIDYTVDVTKPKGERVVELFLEGEVIKDDQTLEVVMNQYRAVGGGDYSMFGAEKIIKEVTIDMTELISGYLERHPIISPVQPTNFKLIY